VSATKHPIVKLRTIHGDWNICVWSFR